MVFALRPVNEVNKDWQTAHTAVWHEIFLKKLHKHGMCVVVIQQYVPTYQPIFPWGVSTSYEEGGYKYITTSSFLYVHLASQQLLHTPIIQYSLNTLNLEGKRSESKMVAL